MELHPIIAVVGPTGSGKSELALRLAEACGGEIVNCDSVQVYRGLDIGTAKVPVEARRGIPHHMVDLFEPDVVFTAGDYARMTRGVLREITARGHIPVLAGGTGFYLRALIEGLAPAPPRSDEVRARLLDRAGRRPGSLHRILKRLDPKAAQAIHPNDVQKTVRAVEVCLLARGKASEQQARPRDALVGFRVLILGLNPDRQHLYQRINTRCQTMFAHGLVQEVRDLLARGVSPEAKPLTSIGYAEALAVVRGERPSAEACELAQIHTRQYAKRQWTWFRRTPGLVWLDGFGDDPAVNREALQRVRRFLTEKLSPSTEQIDGSYVYTDEQPAPNRAVGAEISDRVLNKE